ncbi:hypothetical protein BDW59DRAFT_12369 [Aspergillus cavernicola]|uniref:Fungal N-terminal domain-containing protein n=1 Tax=Aspergillus cavernicola TaxID=176166 RepID=A0ABR4HKN6_9EURO
MVDPFSVAASAAGLLSLGIESCKLIVNYCDGVRGFDDQIDSIGLKADGLLSTLQQIESLLNQTDGIHPTIAADIKEKVLQNENWIRKINERVMRWSVATQNQNTELSDKLRATAKKAVYPFQKESLMGTVDILQGLQMNLHTALLALQIQHASALAKQTELIQRMENLVLAKMGQFDADMGRMELAIRDISSTSQQQQNFTIAKYNHGMCTKQDLSTVCICRKGATSSGAMRIRRTCPQHNRSTIGKSRTKSFSFASLWLGLSFEATISIRRGANGLSICPTLTFHAIVPDDSPAFKLLNPYLRCDLSCEQVIDHYQTVIQKLQQLFDDGYASPFDRTVNGSTLLHMACRSCSVNQIINNHRDQICAMMKYLVEAGCPINERTIFGQTPISALLSQRHQDSESISNLISLGATVTDSHLCGWRVLTPVIPLWLQKREGFLLSDAANAILSQSQDDLKRALELARSERNRNSDIMDGNSLFKISLFWADGIRILHENGVVIPITDMNPLLSWAVSYDQPDTLQALLDIGAPVTNFLRFLLLSSHSEEMDIKLVRKLVAEAEHFSMLAREVLPESVQQKFDLHDGRLPDQEKEDLYMELKNHGVSFNPWLRPWDEGPLYQQYILYLSTSSY